MPWVQCAARSNKVIIQQSSNLCGRAGFECHVDRWRMKCIDLTWLGGGGFRVRLWILIRPPLALNPSQWSQAEGGVRGFLGLSAPIQLKVDTSDFTLILKRKEYLSFMESRRAEMRNYGKSVDAMMMGIFKNNSGCAEGKTVTFRPHPHVDVLF